MFTTKRNVVDLGVCQRVAHVLAIFRIDLAVDHSGIELRAGPMAEDVVQAFIPDRRVSPQIMIEGPQFRALEREALPFLARLQSHLGRAGRRGILENNHHALDVALVIPDGCAAVLDGKFAAVPTDQHRMARPAGECRLA